MFNNRTKKEALRAHAQAVEKYDSVYKDVTDRCEKLYLNRKLSITAITRVVDLINSIANTPKEFETSLSNIKKEKGAFRKTEYFAKEAVETARKAATTSAAGAAGGAAIAALTPKAAMWVATTFGKASTGAAISSLHGIAAEKAALAWLGRGALRAGGKGIAGGKAFLALSGPLGWTIAGAAGVTSALLLTYKNGEIADEAYRETRKIKIACSELQEAEIKINQLIEKTKRLKYQVEIFIIENKHMHSANYPELSEDERLRLGALVNNALALSQLLNETV